MQSVKIVQINYFVENGKLTKVINKSVDIQKEITL